MDWLVLRLLGLPLWVTALIILVMIAIMIVLIKSLIKDIEERA